MSNAISRNYVNFLKVIGIGLLFAPMWGLLWYNVNFNDVWNFGWAWQRVRGQIADGHRLQAAIYAAVYAFALIGIFIIPFIRGSILRVSMVMVLMTGWFIDHFFLEMNGVFSSRDLISLLWDEWHLSADAARAYQAPLLRNLLLAAPIAVVFCIPPRRPISLSRYWALLPGAALFCVGILMNSAKSGQLQFPVPYSLVSTAALLSLGVGGNQPFGYFTAQNIDRNRVIAAPVQRAHQFKKIIMIMDESVRGDQLSLNDAESETTPFLKSEARLINFGIAVSGGNCSSISRAMFRYGLRPYHLPDKWNEGSKSPLIWQFASNAGYRTIHVDGIAGPLQFHNGFTSKEKSLIDTEIAVLDNPEYSRDNKIAERVLSLLADDKAMFLLVDKHGLHFPYANRHPPEEGENRAKTTLEHYSHGITWSVDEFFRRLMTGLNLSDTLMIYTSDHGQNFGPGQTHCTVAKEVSPGEAIVPLFAATGDHSFEQRLRQAAKLGFNKMSHFEIFPTLLVAMGYDENWVKKAYGQSLLDGPADGPRSFMVGNPYLNPEMIKADPDETHQTRLPLR
jgi:glucan phosphoethanolaminetransferase (alkaline phosphatase superfamily)